MSFASFPDEEGKYVINMGNKVRITLSTHAKMVMAEDMEIFNIPTVSTFINLVFDNYKYDAKSSVSLYLEEREAELDRLFGESALNDKNKKAAITCILESEKSAILDDIASFKSSKGDSKLYHINNKNVDYLIDECNEEEYYNGRPGLYIRSVIEEYCSLPFIKRERIIKKDIYETITYACKEKRVLKVRAPYNGQNQLFYVYPYKIASDPLKTQSYLVCYSRMDNEEDKDKIVASFALARMNMPTMQKKTFHLNKQEIKNIEDQITKYSAQYIIGKPEQIRVRLTPQGIEQYKRKLYSRPEKIDSLSSEDVYVFDCPHLQAFNYFFPFGANAEILSPEPLRERFIEAHKAALEKYK